MIETPTEQEKPVNETPALIIAWRYAWLTLCVGAAACLVIYETGVRGLEVKIATWLASFTIATPDTAMVADSGGTPAMVVSYGDNWHALLVTMECSVALYVAPLVFVGGLAGLIPRLSPLRVMIATVVSVSVMVIVNQIRLLTLSFVATRLQDSAFDWAHSIAGSLLMILGVLLALASFAIIAIGFKGKNTIKSRKAD